MVFDLKTNSVLLGASEQDALAQLCELSSRLTHWMNSPDDPAVDEDEVVAAYGLRLWEVMMRVGKPSQFWGVLYDKLHRTGANV